MTFRRSPESYHPMHYSAPIRYAAAASFAFSALLFAQARPASRAKPRVALPATQPTTRPELPPTPEQLPSHPASVTYTNGLLQVSASNSSLNQILRDISRETGMKVTGGVADERVFGRYGPAPVAQILNTLLDGTSSNMLLVESTGTAPAELILTPRQGAASPPSPDTASLDDNDQPEDQGAAKRSVQLGEPAGLIVPTPPVSEGDPASAQPTQPQSPNGVKTPQEIYDQLRKLRQQQPAKPQ